MTTGASFRTISHVVDGSYVREHTRSLLDSDSNTDGARLAFKQYIPLDNLNPKNGDVTIIAAHANGIPKECYEPLFTALLQHSRQSRFRIRSIWIADYFNQGESGVLNADILGNDPCWTDHARDLLIFINTHRKEMPQPLVAVGHSLGASQLVHLSLMHPSLFKALIFLECGWYPPNPGVIAATATLKRRDRWPSREEAVRAFKQLSFYKKWDPRCLDLFFKFGLRDAPTEENRYEVTLTTRKHQELATLLRPVDNSLIDVANATEPKEKFHKPELEQLFRRLPEVKPPVLYLFGEKSGLWSKRKKDIVETTGTALDGSGGKDKYRVEEGIVKDGTHFMPLEKVDDCALQIVAFLGREIPRWLEQLEQHRIKWHAMSRHEQLQAHEMIVEVFGKNIQASKI